MHLLHLLSSHQQIPFGKTTRKQSRAAHLKLDQTVLYQKRNPGRALATRAAGDPHRQTQRQPAIGHRWLCLVSLVNCLPLSPRPISKSAHNFELGLGKFGFGFKIKSMPRLNIRKGKQASVQCFPHSHSLHKCRHFQLNEGTKCKHDQIHRIFEFAHLTK